MVLCRASHAKLSCHKCYLALYLPETGPVGLTGTGPDRGQDILGRAHRHCDRVNTLLTSSHESVFLQRNAIALPPSIQVVSNDQRRHTNATADLVIVIYSPRVNAGCLLCDAVQQKFRPWPSELVFCQSAWLGALTGPCVTLLSGGQNPRRKAHASIITA